MVQSLHKFSLSWVIFLAKCLVVILWAWFGDLGRLLDFAKACFGRLDLFWFVWIFFGLVGFISVWYACLDVSGLLFVCWIFFELVLVLDGLLWLCWACFRFSGVAPVCCACSCFVGLSKSCSALLRFRGLLPFPVS